MIIGIIDILVGLLALLLLGSPFPFNYDNPIAALLLVCIAITLGIHLFQQFRKTRNLNLAKYKIVILGAGVAALLLGIIFLVARTRLAGNFFGLSLMVLGCLISGEHLYKDLKNIKEKKMSKKVLISVQSIVVFACSVAGVILLANNYAINKAFSQKAENVESTEQVQTYDFVNTEDPFGFKNVSYEYNGIYGDHRKTNMLVSPKSLTPGNVTFSWVPKNAKNQSGFEISITENEKEVYSSGKIDSSEVRFEPDFQSESGKSYVWYLTLYDEAGNPGKTLSDTFGTSLAKDDWQAVWINPESDTTAPTKKNRHSASYLRKTFEITQEQIAGKKIMLYATAHGVYDMWVNGTHVDYWFMAPGFTQYTDILQTQSYDITPYLKAGDNEIFVQIGDGWYRGSLDKEQVINSFGTDVAFLCEARSGNNVILQTDGTWEAANDGWLSQNDLHDGEVYDANKNISDFTWHAVTTPDYGYDNLTGSDCQPITQHEEFTPEIITTPAGETVLDFGQNFSGYVQLDINAQGGEKITLTHGETLDENGNFTISNFQASKSLPTLQNVLYTCKKGENTYHPTTTYFGFRYVKVETDIPITAENFKGVAVYSDMEQTGFFESGNPKVNQLFHNTLWSMKSNFVGVMTDCPTREKSGYAGDGQIFAPTGLYLMDSYPVYDSWLKSYSHVFHENGSLMQFAPTKLTKSLFDSSHGWSDAIVIIPYDMWKNTGDLQVVKDNYEASKRWVDYALTRASSKTHLYYRNQLDKSLYPYFADQGFGWGEWLEADYNHTVTMVTILANNTLMGEPEVGTAFLYQSCKELSEMAQALGHTEDAEYYANAADKAKQAYRQVFTENGKITEKNRQSRFIRPISMGLLDEEESGAASDQLAELITNNNNHLNTGFLSTGSLLQTLSDYGNTTKAYDVLLQKTLPSWLYAVDNGATTIWETWDAVKEDGSVSSSMNHYSFGAVCSWLMDSAAGIKLEDGRITISPKTDSRLGYVNASYDSAYGTIKSAWAYKDGAIYFEFEIPCNTRASIELPDGTKQEVGSGVYSYMIKE